MRRIRANACGVEDEMIPFYWDLTHPTTQIHAGLAKDMAAELQQDADVPEPTTLTLAALGLAAVAVGRRRAA